VDCLSRRAGQGDHVDRQNKAKVFVEKDIKIGSSDVAGVDAAKEELREILAFLRGSARTIYNGRSEWPVP
jgi:ATP-dependent Zn protease